VNAELRAARLGVRRGWIELRQMFTAPSDLTVTLISTAIFLSVMLFMRNSRVPGTGFSLGTTGLFLFSGQSWRHLATVGVLAGWTAAGLLLAPVVPRRMARRESGSTVAARRERVLLRT
jgi:hypothetical protein